MIYQPHAYCCDDARDMLTYKRVSDWLLDCARRKEISDGE